MSDEMIYYKGVGYVTYSAHERLMIDKDQQLTTLRAEVERHKAAHETTAEKLHFYIDETATLRAEIERLRGLLKSWESRGCPDCGGDCSAANPPVLCCIMQETRAALAQEKPPLTSAEILARPDIPGVVDRNCG